MADTSSNHILSGYILGTKQIVSVLATKQKICLATIYCCLSLLSGIKYQTSYYPCLGPIWALLAMLSLKELFCYFFMFSDAGLQNLLLANSILNRK